MALSATCFSIPSFNLYHTLLLALVSVIAFTCSSCALLLIYWAPCPIVLAGSLSFSSLLSLSLSQPVDVAEYVFLSPCLPGLVSLSCHLLFLSCSLLWNFSCSCLLLFYIYLVCSSLDLLVLYLFVILWFSCVVKLVISLLLFFLLVIFLFYWSPCLYWTSYVPVEPCPVLSLCCYRVPVLTCSCYWFTLPGTWPASESAVNKYLSSALWCLAWRFPSAWPCRFFCCYSTCWCPGYPSGVP